MGNWSQKIKGKRYALIGFPEDRGVRTNNGRPGAAEGPAAIRKEFASQVDFERFGLVDLGDIRDADSLLKRQQLL